MNVHVSRTLVISVSVVAMVMAAGCLTLTTVDQSAGSGGTSSSSSGSSNGSSTSTSSSSSGECATVQDCPDTSSCKTMACIDATCVSGFDPAGASCSGDKVCDGSGDCVDCLNSNDCSGTSPTCTNNQCISCSDGIQNGSETAVDCGGSKCNSCIVTACTTATDCATANCVDGVCCDTPCTEVCKSCNLANKVGKCSSLPSGTEDPGVCDTTKECSGFTAKCLLKDGQPCTEDNQCASDDCSTITAMCVP